MSLVGKNIGNYRITRKLGEGGMGAVYLGEHPLIGKKVAVKVLLDELAMKEDIVSRFFNEAKAVNDIGHQNIVDIVDFGKTELDGKSIVYFIMEFLEGEALGERLQRGGMSFADTLHVVEQACSALAASHKKGIVHRDLKPDNIFLVTRGRDQSFVKLLDFGIAKLTGDAGQSSKTRTGSVIGTPAYMSPEQCEGKGQIDHRSDIYSLGIVMYELLTGEVPFGGEGFGEILVAQITQKPKLPSEINPHITPELEALVMHALEKDRTRRYQSMEEMAQAVANPAAHLAAYREQPAARSGVHSGGTLYLDENAPPPVTQEPERRGPITRSQPNDGRPTTLSQAAVEVGADLPAGKSRAPLYAVLGALLLLGGGGLGLAVLKKGDRAAQPSTPPPAPAEYEVTIDSEPSGATVRAPLQGVLGKTPLTLQVHPNEPEFDVQLSLEGYRPVTQSVKTDARQHFNLSLPKVEEPAPVTPPPVATPEPPAPTPVAKADKKDRHHHGQGSSGAKPSGDDPLGGDVLMKPGFLDK